MSARPGFLVNVDHYADGGRSPNQYQPRITAEIRCFWPPLAPRSEVTAALIEVYSKALAEVVKIHGRALHRPAPCRDLACRVTDEQVKCNTNPEGN